MTALGTFGEVIKIEGLVKNPSTLTVLDSGGYHY
jgi:hypothetical protein